MMKHVKTTVIHHLTHMSLSNHVNTEGWDARGFRLGQQAGWRATTLFWRGRTLAILALLGFGVQDRARSLVLRNFVVASHPHIGF